MSLLFFDTEFTGLRKNTTLISLGIVSDNGKKFYAEFTDYDENQCDELIKNNVVKNLHLDGMGDGVSDLNEKPSGIMVRGDKKYIEKELKEWLSQFDSIQFVSDVCHYDFVLLIDLITGGGTALDLPDNISAVCHDINSDIARYYGISERGAFDFSREETMYDVCMGCNYVEGTKHNALYDAEVIKAIWEEVNAGV